jgi:hypothetical protein
MHLKLPYRASGLAYADAAAIVINYQVAWKQEQGTAIPNRKEALLTA